LLNKLSINKKPTKTVTNDLDVQRLTKYTNTKKPTKTSTKTTTKTTKPATKSTKSSNYNNVDIQRLTKYNSKGSGVSVTPTSSNKTYKLVDTNKQNWRDKLQQIRERH